MEEGDSSSLTRTRIQDGGGSAGDGDEVSWRSCTLHSGLQLRVQGIKAIATTGGYSQELALCDAACTTLQWPRMGADKSAS